MIVLPCGNILCACRPCCHTNQLVLAKTCRTWVSTLDSLKSTLLCFFKSVLPLFSHVLYQPSCGCFRQTERGAARGSHAAERKAEGLWGNLGWSLHPGSSHGSRQSESPQPAAKQLPGQPGRSHQQRSAACSEWADGWDKVRVKVNVLNVSEWVCQSEQVKMGRGEGGGLVRQSEEASQINARSSVVWNESLSECVKVSVCWVSVSEWESEWAAG